MKLQVLQDRVIASAKLGSGKKLTHEESEADLEFLSHWVTLPSPAKANPVLNRLAEEIRRNHNDSWLADFTAGPSSPAANTMLVNAINANLSGDPAKGFDYANSARRAFERVGNISAILRSELESLYGLRRQLKAAECKARYASLRPFLGRPYPWLNARLALEASACLALNEEFDAAWSLVRSARVYLNGTRYQSLELRTLSIEGALDTAEGRIEQSWQAQQKGLGAFWNGIFAGERGFQFYSDLEFAAERKRLWYLAARLQSEALAQLPIQRHDFQAIAHCRMASLLASTGSSIIADSELQQSEVAFARLPLTFSTSLYRADCEVARGELEINSGRFNSARNHLTNLQNTLRITTGFTTRLRYERAWAHLEAALGDSLAEKEHLESILEIGNAGFKSLKSPQERWDWGQQVGDAYRRLEQSRLMQEHDPAEGLANWERLHNVDRKGPVQIVASSTISVADPTLTRLRALHRGTLVAYAVFPSWTNAWVADDRGIHEIRIRVDSRTLRRLVTHFFRLCSEPTTPLEKVTDAGSRLYQLLIAPIEQFLDQKRTLFVDSDEFLGSVAWAALVDGNGHYLGGRFVIVNMPDVWKKLDRDSGIGFRGRLLIASPGAITGEDGRYLPSSSASEEAQYIGSLYTQSRILWGREVTVRRLVSELAQSDIFHFAGHAVTREGGGELVVHGETGGTNLMSAAHLAKLKSGPSLVLLSACRTSGDSESAHDPNGLVNAFLDLGSFRVIASLWDVDSKGTLELMKHFYANLHANQDPSTALAQASLSLQKSGLGHPYYWASFQIYGPMN